MEHYHHREGSMIIVCSVLKEISPRLANAKFNTRPKNCTYPPASSAVSSDTKTEAACASHSIPGAQQPKTKCITTCEILAQNRPRIPFFGYPILWTDTPKRNFRIQNDFDMLRAT